MSGYTYDDFDWEKPIEEWSEEEKAALMDRVAEIDDELAEVMRAQPSEGGGSAA